MTADFLHNHKQFKDLLNIISEQMGIQPGLVEKDYWIMHVLYGLKAQGFQFELKGGTSLSKGLQIIQRFSEDIDIHISPPAHLKVNETSSKPNAVSGRKQFYDWLSENIHIDGITSNQRDTAFDNHTSYKSGGIRLLYDTNFDAIAGIKEGILLEAGFDNIAPNQQVDISSWAYDLAKESGIEIIDNRATGIACYHPGYTFVEKLQTIATKYRRETQTADTSQNFMRQYYDLYSLLNNKQVLDFIGTDEYHSHKEKRFPSADKLVPIRENPAFILKDEKVKDSFIKRYKNTEALYYNGQPSFEELLERISAHLHQL